MTLALARVIIKKLIYSNHLLEVLSNQVNRVLQVHLWIPVIKRYETDIGHQYAVELVTQPFRSVGEALLL